MEMSLIFPNGRNTAFNTSTVTSSASPPVKVREKEE
jgi:hypothetical protein